jgi:acetyl esterase/lipase
LILVATVYSVCSFAKQPVPDAVIADPPPDTKFPARMEVIHVPSGDVKINAVVYVPSGPGPHPAVVFFHGLPGNEKNLDLAQAVRRAGWTVVTVNYRGSWGSPGNFRFAQNLEDAQATLAFIRAPENANRLSIDTNRIALAGHSMGGWVTAVHRRLLVLYSNDFVKADSTAFISAIKNAGGKTISSNYVATDHSWSDHRIALESLVINWLQSLPTHP